MRYVRTVHLHSAFGMLIKSSTQYESQLEDSSIRFSGKEQSVLEISGGILQ